MDAGRSEPMASPDLPELINAATRELAVLLSPPAAEMPSDLGTSVPDDADDFAAEQLVDTTSAGARFGLHRHTVARWCRTEGVGVRRGGRWLVSIPRLRARLNGMSG